MLSWMTPLGGRLSEMERLRRGFDNLFETAYGPRSYFTAERAGLGKLFPLLNVRQSGDAFVVTAEIPGIKMEDVEINVQGDTLSLKGFREGACPTEGGCYHRQERTPGQFQRSITFPKKVDADKGQATYKDGILMITLPIHVSEKPRQISVTVG